MRFLISVGTFGSTTSTKVPLRHLICDKQTADSPSCLAQNFLRSMRFLISVGTFESTTSTKEALRLLKLRYGADGRVITFGHLILCAIDDEVAQSVGAHFALILLVGGVEFLTLR